jgi:hypothetical protein
MVSPLTDRSSATSSIAPERPAAPELLPADVRRAVAEIAAWFDRWL